MDFQEDIIRGALRATAGLATAIILRRLHLWRQSRGQTKLIQIFVWLINPDSLALITAISTLVILWLHPHAPIDRPQGQLDGIYVVVATLLVYFMQFGFIAFEAGATHKTYGFESAVKNLLVFIVAYSSYYWLGTRIQARFDSDFVGAGALKIAFNAGFASTVALIVANTLTERTSLPANLFLSFVSAGIAFPFMAGVVWGNGWLAQQGFVDGAGGCVVHLLGGSIGLFAAYRVGPRFRTQGWHFLDKPPRPDQRALIPLTVVGGLFLWFGWLGFNSGNTHNEPAFLNAFLNTSLGACGGGFAAIIIAIIARFFQSLNKNSRMPWTLRQMADLERVLIGMMGGLVCVTSNASFVHPLQAFVESVVGGGAAVGITAFVSNYGYRFDDPLAAVATHAGAGFVGVAIFTPLWINRSHFLVQLMGCGICVVSAWVLASLVSGCFVVLSRLMLDRKNGLAESMMRNLRLRLSASRQVTGKMGFESLGPAVEAAQALSLVRDGPRSNGDDEDWRKAVGEIAMAEDSFSDKSALEQIIELLEHCKIGGKNERQALAAISMVCQNDNLERCLSSCLNRAQNHLTPEIGWTPWSKLDHHYQEVLVWTIGALADRLCFANVWANPISANTKNLFKIAIEVLAKIQQDKSQRSSVRDLAREGQMDLENSNLYGIA